jgi:hypothetical protein
MSKVARLMNIHYVTVECFLDAWEQTEKQNCFSVLRQAEGQGAKVKLSSIASEIPKLMEEHY